MTPQPRRTKQREAIREAFGNSERPLSPQEVLDIAAREVPTMSLATVYRTVQALLDEGEITRVDLPGESARYELAGRGHHHHFHCRSCGRAFDIHACPGGLGDLAPSGFTVDGHDLTLYGRCEACNAERARRTGAGSRP